MRASFVGLCVLMVACGSDRDGRPATPAPPPEPPAPSPAPPPASADDLPSGEARATTLRIRNEGDELLAFETGGGPLSFVTVAEGSGATGALWLEGDIYCDCVCEPDTRCPDCEAPSPSTLEIAAGETRELSWNGFLRRRRMGDECQERFAPSGEQYVVAACSRDRCASALVSLPTSDPIVLAFGDRAVPAGCANVESVIVERAARLALRQIRLSASLGERLDRCGTDAATCVETAALEAARAGVPPGGCRHFFVPHDGQLEVETFLPLPEGTNGGESFRVWLDPAATSVRRVRFEQ